MSSESTLICSRCKTEPSVTISRKEAFCRLCFIRFISGKQRKQMSSDKFKIKFGDSVKVENVLFPCSFGPSSVVLLDIIMGLLQEQVKNTRAKLGFKLTVLFIDDSAFESYENKAQDIIESLKAHYDISQFPVEFITLDINSFFATQSNLSKLRINPSYETFKIAQQLGTDTKYTITDLLQSLPNRAARHDLLQVIKKHLISDFITTHGIRTVLYGHNMTTLANQVIALTVKGRGSEIYAQLTDGLYDIQGEQIEVIHPLRDVAYTEVATFIELQNLKQFTLVPKSTILMNKQKTINEVVNQYYQTVDVDSTSNIVSTVVKTGAKLDEPKDKLSKEERCSCCGGKIYSAPDSWLRDISYTSSKGPQNEIEEESLREWQEENKELLKELSVDGDRVGLCYGCIVTLGPAKSDLKWPDMSARRGRSKEEILNEFILDDDSDEE